jgi:hypothetical protein
LEEDRHFILTAIRAWYGSEEAFTAYVRGPLRQELMCRTSLPIGYALIAAAGPLGATLDIVEAWIQGGAPARRVLSFFVSAGLGWALCWNLLGLKILWRLCDRFAARRKSQLLDFGVSFLVFLAFDVFYLRARIAGRPPELSVAPSAWL